MNKKLLGSLHRWIFMFMGIIMIVWLVSGIVMIMPHKWFGGITRNDQPAIDDYHSISLSPAEAIARLEQHAGGHLDVKQIKLIQIHTDLYYRITARRNTAELISTLTGERFEFPPALAEQVARHNFNIESPLLESVWLTEHSSGYPYGDLPVYRLRFERLPGQFYYVNRNNGSVSRSTTLSRIYNGIVSLHGFHPVEALTGSKDLRMFLLYMTGALSLVGSTIGLLLIFPLRRKRGTQTD